MTTKAKKLLELVAQAIEAEPLRVNMDQWLVHGWDLKALKADDRAPACGIVGCIAGWVCVLHDKRKKVTDTYANQAENHAIDTLGLKFGTDTLFYISYWPAKFRRKIQQMGTGTPEYAAVVAARIRHFIATDGTDV